MRQQLKQQQLDFSMRPPLNVQSWFYNKMIDTIIKNAARFNDTYQHFGHNYIKIGDITITNDPECRKIEINSYDTPNVHSIQFTFSNENVNVNKYSTDENFNISYSHFNDDSFKLITENIFKDKDIETMYEPLKSQLSEHLNTDNDVNSCSSQQYNNRIRHNNTRTRRTVFEGIEHFGDSNLNRHGRRHIVINDDHDMGCQCNLNQNGCNMLCECNIF